MAKGKIEDEWNRTSLVCCILANANRDPKRKPFTISDFHPFLNIKTTDVIKDSKLGFKQLKKLFVKKRKLEQQENIRDIAKKK